MDVSQTEPLLEFPSQAALINIVPTQAYDGNYSILGCLNPILGQSLTYKQDANG